MKTITILLHLSVLACFSQSIAGKGSEAVCLQATITPKAGTEPLKNAEVTLMLGNKVLFTILRPNSVKGYEFILLRDTLYTIVINCPGRTQRKISINTRIPANVNSFPLFRFEAIIDLPPADAGFDPEYLDFPIAMIEYDIRKDLFIYRKKYTENIKFMLTEEKPVIVRRQPQGEE